MAALLAAAAAAVPPSAAAAVVLPVEPAAAAAQAPPASTRLMSERLAALVLFVVLLGCAGAGLAFLVILQAQGKACTPPTHAEVAVASTQVLLAPAPVVPSEAPTSAAVPEPTAVATSPHHPILGPPAKRLPPFVPSAGAAEAPTSAAVPEPTAVATSPHHPILGPPAKRLPPFVPSAGAAANCSSLCVLGLALGLALLLL